MARETAVASRSHSFWKECIRKERDYTAPRSRCDDEENHSMRSTAGIAYGLAGNFLNPTMFPKALGGTSRQKTSNAVGSTSSSKKHKTPMMEALMSILSQGQKARVNQGPAKRFNDLPAAGRPTVRDAPEEALLAQGLPVSRPELQPTPPKAAETRRAWSLEADAQPSKRPTTPGGAPPALPVTGLPDAIARAVSPARKPRTPKTAAGSDQAKFAASPAGHRRVATPVPKQPAGYQNSYRAEFLDFTGNVHLTPGSPGKRRAWQCGHGLNGCSDGGWVGADPVSTVYRESCLASLAATGNGLGFDTVVDTGWKDCKRTSEGGNGMLMDHRSQPVQFIDTKYLYSLDSPEERELLAHLQNG